MQAPVPEVGAGRGGIGGGQLPQTTEPQQPTGQATPPRRQPPPRPRPCSPIPAPPPMTARGQADAAELELQAALRGEIIERPHHHPQLAPPPT